CSGEGREKTVVRCVARGRRRSALRDQVRPRRLRCLLLSLPSNRGERSLRNLTADHGSHIEQFGKKRVLEGTLEESHPARTPGAALVADDSLDRFQVPKAPELETL